MRHIKRGIITAVLALAALLGAVTTAPVVAAADTKQACAQELGITQPTMSDAANKTPVVLVPGLWSDRSSLLAMDKSLVFLKDVTTYRFDYESTNDRWVTEGDTAHRLAATIICYSKLYGGKRVVVVAHSMGGLLTRAALDQAAYGTYAKKVTGHIVTIGTPHKGADISDISYTADISLCNATFFWWGDEARKNCDTIEAGKAVAAMRPSSAQLAALPRFPSGISVEAIAGEVKRRICSPWSCSEDSTGGDLVVPVKSATDEFTTTGVGDGKKVFACTAVLALPQASHPWCEHNAMLQAPQVQAEVKTSIQAYLASVKRAEMTRFTQKIQLDILTIPAPKTWVIQEPGVDPVTVIDDPTCGSREYGDYWKLCARFTVAADGDSLKGNWDSLCSDKLLSTTKSNIGGRVATLYKYGPCKAYESLGAAYLWHIPGSVAVEYHLSAKGEEMASIKTALAGAVWR